MDDFVDNGRGLLVPHDHVKCKGIYHLVHKRKGIVIDEWDDHNLVVNQGLNYQLGVALQGVAQISAWYLGIFQGNYTPVLTDTAATVSVNSTECSSYTQGARQLWQPAAAASQSITNSANPATFTFNAAVTVYGAFMVSSNAIGGTSGTLWGEAAFSSAKAVSSGDQLLITYTFTASG